MPKLSKGARLLRMWDLLVYLDKSADITLEQLAVEFGTPEKQLRADLELLAGVETPDNIGFYLVDLDYDALEDEGVVRLSLKSPAHIPVQFADDDIIPLIAGLKAIGESTFVQNDPKRAAVVQSALEKLTQVSGSKATAIDIKLPDATNTALAQQIADAIATHKQLVIKYVNSDDVVTTRVVDPAVVVMQNRYAYLRAWCHQRNEERAFRIDRILSATLARAACPEHLAAITTNADVATETVSQSVFTATVTLTNAARWLAEELPGQVTELSDGTFRLVLHSTSHSWLIRLLLGVAPAVLAIEPAEIASEVAQVARQALTSYAS